MPRKPLPEAESRRSPVHIMLNREERDTLTRAADLASADSLAGYIRQIALDYSRAVLQAMASRAAKQH